MHRLRRNKMKPKEYIPLFIDVLPIHGTDVLTFSHGFDGEEIELFPQD